MCDVQLVADMLQAYCKSSKLDRFCALHTL